MIWNLDEGLSKAYKWLNSWRNKNWQLGLPSGYAERGLVAVMDFLDHEIMGQNMGADQRIALQAAGSWAVTVHYLLEIDH